MESLLYIELNTTRSAMLNRVETDLRKIVSGDYSSAIADRIVDDIAMDISETADHDNWNDADFRLAFGRVLCDALGIEF